jgi:hypothetical protein
MRGISRVYVFRRAQRKSWRSLKVTVDVSILVHAVFVLICTLRDHRGWCGDVGDFDVVLIANEGLRVETEGVTHEFGDTILILVVIHFKNWGRTYPQTTTSSSMEPQRRATVELSLEP